MSADLLIKYLSFASIFTIGLMALYYYWDIDNE